MSRAAPVTVLAVALLGARAAAAQDYSFPSSADDIGFYYPTAYMDRGGRDWNCGSVYYSGHRGSDFGMGSWSGMAAGRDITAAADGVVTTAHDGEFDACTTGRCAGGCGNMVVIRHADGRSTWYCHFKKWTILVSRGQTVRCGQKLGEAGSSGYSTGPHLHFAPYRSTAIEPFQGACGSSSSSWLSQGVYRRLPANTCATADGDGDGYTTGSGDCDDGDPTVSPGATEFCNGRDDDCDGLRDEPDAADARTWYTDADGDGFGDPATGVRACTAPAGTVADNTDCDDTDPFIYPGALELCSGEDEDCDGDLDEDFDLDADAYRTCDGDCDDADPSRHPGVPEVEDHIDNDCDWRVDEGGLSYDDDGDGWSDDAGDCDDGDAFSFPGAPEMADGADDDCDGAVDEGTLGVDDDGDGFSEAAGDCDDADPAVFPGAPEAPGGSDDDCDGRVDEGTVTHDDDGDSFAEVAGDCDDRARTVFPGAPELPDGVDNDCDGAVDEGTDRVDDDGDGWSEDEGDCADADPAVYPGAPELADAVDQDCNFLVDDGTDLWDDDHDGWAEADGDCDDGDPRRHPEAVEPPGQGDLDCDGEVAVPEGWGAAGCAARPGAALGGLGVLGLALGWTRRRRR